MRYFVCLLLLAGCTTKTGVLTSSDMDSLKSSLRISGETIVAKQDQSIAILKENTTALAAIKDQMDTLKASQVESESGSGIGGDLESDAPQNTDTDANESHGSSPGSQPVAVSAAQLFVTSSESCTPCKRLWEDVAAGKLEGFDVRKAPDFEGIKSYPAIRFRYKASETGWGVRYGYDHVELQWLKDNLLPRTGSGGAPVSGAFFQVSRQPAIQSSGPVIRSVSRWQGFFGRSRTVSR